ncbi:MAG: ABC transporter permease, partial [Bacteroidetes bacterium]
MHYFYQQLVSAAKSAVRNFQKNRLYGSLNILGLSISFCTVILVMAYLYQETNYESFHSKADRIYRPTHHIKTQQDFEVHFARIPVDYINQLPDELPEVEKLIRFQNKEQKHIRIGEKRFKPKYAFLTDRDVFEVFDFPLIEGDPETALANPYTVVLTESIARKYYGRTNVVGETMIVTGDWSDEEKEYKVTGVMQDLPVNTHLPVDLLFSFASPEERSGWAYIYTLLAEGADIASVEAKMPAFIQNHADPESTAKVEFAFQPLPGIHLHSNLAREIKPNGQVLYVRIFFWVGLLVWIIALVNFANLSTALAMGRGREAGVRRILGASKANLILFSLSESVIYSMVAMAAGGTLAWLLFPAFSDLTGIVILPPLPYSIGLLLGLTLASGILAGILPGMVLISVQALQIIKQGNNWSMRRAGRQLNVRQGLIAIQFCAAVILIGSALVAHRQFAFIRTKNLG